MQEADGTRVSTQFAYRLPIDDSVINPEVDCRNLLPGLKLPFTHKASPYLPASYYRLLLDDKGIWPAIDPACITWHTQTVSKHTEDNTVSFCLRT